MVKIKIYEKNREPYCADPDCCGYYYEMGDSADVEVTEEVYEQLVKDVEDLYFYETVDAENYGINCEIKDIGYVDRLD